MDHTKATTSYAMRIEGAEYSPCSLVVANYVNHCTIKLIAKEGDYKVLGVCHLNDEGRTRLIGKLTNAH